ncbi:hypothetical protein N9247_00840 [bacterium]|nr:hypothetical protein [bacterium]
MSRTETLAGLKQIVESRGSRVVFVRNPAGGDSLDVETRIFSREAGFDRVVLETDADGVQYADHPGRLDLTLPEGSHLVVRPCGGFDRHLHRHRGGPLPLSGTLERH